jgi:thiamine biosynthesis lipoprotein ApbE
MCHIAFKKTGKLISPLYIVTIVPEIKNKADIKSTVLSLKLSRKSIKKLTEKMRSRAGTIRVEIWKNSNLLIK